jgi:hypothetical protein
MQRSRLWRALSIAAAVAVMATACTTDEADDTAPATTAPTPTAMSQVDQEALAAQLAAAPGCDPLDARSCLLPFPSDQFTEDDPTAPSGRRVAFGTEVMPVNASGVAIDPAGWNDNDGFSPGTPMVAAVPGVDLEASGAPPIDDVARSLEPGSAAVVVDLDTGERVPVWAELDTDSAAEGEQVVIVRPARNLTAGHRHAVGLVGLVDGDGSDIETSLAFRAYRDALTTDIDEVEARRPAMDEAIGGLADVGVERQSLTLAWGFTVASTENVTGPLLAMRDDALATIGDGAPAFTVTRVVEAPSDELDEGIARIVEGTFDVPLYLTGAGEPGATLNDPDGDGAPDADGTFAAPFVCQVPETSLDEPSRPVVYGHGLLGSAGEVTSGHVSAAASANNMTYCATDWIGMSTADLGTVISVLSDLSGFPAVPDRSLQGILNAVVLGRLVRSDDGFAADRAFQSPTGSSLVASGDAFYDGNSQGGIMGAAATAVSPEWERAVLGVPGMNYSTLLRRSVDFVGKPGELGFEDVLVPSYPDVVERALVYGLIQMLWDRAEGNGYAAHLTDDPLPGTPAHQVLLHVAYGDHQVADVTAQVMARTGGVGLRSPALADDRTVGDLWGLDAVDDFPHDGSILVFWDSGTLPPPPGNISPIESEQYTVDCPIGSDGEPPDTAACEDPHEDPRRQPAAIAQKDAFLRTDGEVIDPCDGEPCQATPRSQL